MTARGYKHLAVDWVPDSHEKRAFYVITALVMTAVLLIASAVSLVEVPPKERQPRQAVPERVAKFITQQKQAQPTPPPVATPTPRPIPTPKPKVARKRETEAEKRQPLTREEKKARDKAAQSGLLALSGELADLIDTGDLSAVVGAKTRKSSGAATTAGGADTGLLTAGATRGSGGVDTSDYVGSVSSTQLSARDVALVKQSLVKGDRVAGDTAAGGESQRERGGRVRTEEEVTIVFDQNKGQLFSIYNRERRKKPGLKGKIVLEITIAADGLVTKVKIASSELNDPALERRIVARVKRFKFAARDVEPVTVTFPIEFLPS